MLWIMLAPLLLVAIPGAPPEPLAHTYSIIARDPVTGDFGVAVQSHYFSVGSIVPWAESGIGAVATQSIVDPNYGPRGLALMRLGLTAQQALDSLRRVDANSTVRQVAMIDAFGHVAVYTGPGSIPDAGQIVGNQYSVQANLMSSPRVWKAMAEGYERARGDLAERLLQALERGERAGGDIRGSQSAAILIVRAHPTGDFWRDRLFDLRVEDHPAPVQELRRLVTLRRAYMYSDRGDSLIAAKNTAGAMQAYQKAAELAPDVVELQFWAAVTMMTNGLDADALPIFKRVFARERRWVDLVPRLAKVGLFPTDEKKIALVRAQAPASGPR